MTRRWMILLCILTLSLPTLAQATPTPPAIEPLGSVIGLDFAISFPPPVYVLSGNVEIRGTANKPNQNSYFLEFRPLSATPSLADAWFPASLPSNARVTDGLLGVWDTSVVPDGLYELRLVGNVSGQPVQYFRVAPLRVDNSTPRPVATATPVVGFVTPALPVIIPTLPNQPLQPSPVQPNRPQATPTALGALGGNRVVAITNANVRQGDGLEYRIVGTMLSGETLPVLGISTVAGWYYVELANGRRGFVAPSVVNFIGNMATLRLIQPPPVPATATPIATATPTAVADLLPGTFALSPATPICNQPFFVEVNINNVGSGASDRDVVIEIRDRHLASNTVTTSVSVTVPSINAGQLYFIRPQLVVSTFYAEEHQIEIVVDRDNALPETNKANNFATIRYTLQQGGC